MPAATPWATRATFRRHLARLTRSWPTRRTLARCGRLATWRPAEPPPAPIEEPFHAELPGPVSADRFEGGPAAPAAPLVCTTCAGADFYSSRAKPGIHRCRACGTETCDKF